MHAPEHLDGFTLTRAPAGTTWAWPVYAAGEGPPVVVLHELMGFTPEILAFAGRLQASGFRVYLPVLFGPLPADTRVTQARAMIRALCLSREITKFATGKTSPIVTPLRALVASVTTTGHPRVGVVGMCLTGGFALALAGSPEVYAAVASQPSLPVATPVTPWCADHFGLSTDDEDATRTRLESGEVEIFYARFSQDKKSPHRRLEAVKERLGTTGLTPVVLDSAEGNEWGFKDSAHSVLSVAPTQYPADSPAHAKLAATAAEVSAFLHRRLATGATDDRG